MPNLQYVTEPYFPPQRCAVCGTSTCPDGFVDTLVDLPGPPGRLYVCGRCVIEAVRIVPLFAATFQQQVSELGRQVEALNAELAVERENKLVSLADARQLVKDAS